MVQVRTGSGGFLEVLVLLMRSGGFWCSFGRCAFSARLKVLCHPPTPPILLLGVDEGRSKNGGFVARAQLSQKYVRSSGPDP